MHSANPNPVNQWRDRIVGLDRLMPLLDGRLAPYINLDNAASTPPLLAVVEAVERFLPYYSSVHRGAGFKSRVSTAAYDDAHETIARFVGADPAGSTVIFGKNTTEAINKLAYRYPFARRSVVLSTEMEHHSNDLPWRGRAQRRVERHRVRAADPSSGAKGSRGRGAYPRRCSRMSHGCWGSPGWSRHVGCRNISQAIDPPNLEWFG